MVERAAHYLLHGLRRDLLLARKVRRDERQREELVVDHGIVVADVIGPLHDLAADPLALSHDLRGAGLVVPLGEDLFHRTLKHPEIKTVILHAAHLPVSIF